MAAQESRPTLGYWKIRGLAQPIRMLLCHMNVDFEDVLYEAHKNDDGSWDRSEWTDVKPKFLAEGMSYPNLPYFQHDGLQITQSVAILTYCAEAFGLHKDFTAKERGAALMHAEQVQDLRNGAVRQFYGGGDVGQYCERVKTSFEKFKEQLAKSDGPYLMGEKICGADFHLAEMVIQHRMLDANIFTEMPSLISYQENVFGLPGVSNADQTLPCNNKMASFGGAFIQPPTAENN